LNRRDALQRVAFLMGGVVSAPTMVAMLEGCKSSTATEATNAAFGFSADQKSLVSEIAEMIIPKTTTPGAKDAKVGEFIELMLKDCYTSKQQEIFSKGLTAVEEAAKKASGKSFVESSNEQKTAILKQFEALSNEEIAKSKSEAKIKDAETGLMKESKSKKDETPPPFFRLMKELTLLGYFTSEQGAKNALAYVQVPGKYVGCVKMEKGQKAWAL
jgi:Gluconate 2-dehydrogenase subunit 3